jgi:hypothetical protein
MSKKTNSYSLIVQLFPLFLANEGLYVVPISEAGQPTNSEQLCDVYFFIPEAKGKSLETMYVLFGGANHAEDTTPDDEPVLGAETPGHGETKTIGEKKTVASVVSDDKTNVKVNDSSA